MLSHLVSLVNTEASRYFSVASITFFTWITSLDGSLKLPSFKKSLNICWSSGQWLCCSVGRPEVRGWNPVNGKKLFTFNICFLATVYWRDENKEKEAGNGPKNICWSELATPTHRNVEHKIMALTCLKSQESKNNGHLLMPTINSRCQLTPTHAPGDLIKNFF